MTSFRPDTATRKITGFYTSEGGSASNLVSATVTVSGTSFTNAAGGTIAGEGAFNVSSVAFTNDGVVSPGFSPGILTVNGNYHQLSGGDVLRLERSFVLVHKVGRLPLDGLGRCPAG